MSIHTHHSEFIDPVMRGRDVGQRWTDQIEAAVTEYHRHFDRVGIDAEVVRRVSDASSERIARATPELAAEIEGIAIGAGLPHWQVVMLNARTEILALSPPAEECSTSVHWPSEGVPHTLQTWDWRPGIAGAGLVSTFTGSEGIDVVTFSEFGQVGKIGVNSQGLGLHFNILRHSRDGYGSGVPVHVAARHILNTASTVPEAIEVARSLSYGASSVFTVASAAGHPRAACLEVSPVGVAVIEGRPGQQLNHTNHFLDPELAAGAAPANPVSTSPARLEFLTEQSDALAIPHPVQRIQALAQVPDVTICVRRVPGVPAHQDTETKATIALDLTRPSLGIHPGGPRDVRAEDWRTFAF